MIFDKRYFVAFFSLHSIRCYSHTIVTNVAYAQYNIVKKLTEEKLSQMSIRKNKAWSEEKNRWAQTDWQKNLRWAKQRWVLFWHQMSRLSSRLATPTTVMTVVLMLRQKIADLWKVTNLKVLMAEKVLMSDADDQQKSHQ